MTYAISGNPSKGDNRMKPIKEFCKKGIFSERERGKLADVLIVFENSGKKVQTYKDNNKITVNAEMLEYFEELFPELFI